MFLMWLHKTDIDSSSYTVKTGLNVRVYVGPYLLVINTFFFMF